MGRSGETFLSRLLAATSRKRGAKDVAGVGDGTEISAKTEQKEEEEGSVGGGVAAMGSSLGDWPSHNPHNFSQLVPADPSAQPSNVTPATYIATHRTDPPPDQVITTDSRNILLRHFYQKSEEKLRPKRAAPDNLTLQNNCKQPRGPVADGGSQSSSRS